MASSIIVHAIAKLFLIGGAGFAAVRFGLLDERAVRGLSRYVTYLSLPCLIVGTFGRVLQLDYAGRLVLCMAGGGAVLVSGMLLAWLAWAIIFGNQNSQSRGLFISLSSMNNSGYLPIPLVTAILPEGSRDEALLYTFMYMFVMGVLFWSLGVRLVSGAAASSREKLRRILNPPMAAFVLSFGFLVPGMREWFLEVPVLQSSVILLGESTIPIVLIILGGSLALPRYQTESGWPIVLGSAFIRLALVPAITLLILERISAGEMLGFILALEACMPAATNHVVVVQEYGGDAALTSRALLVQYIAAVVTIPVFISLF